METDIYKHPEYPTAITVTTLEKGECQGWAGDKYVSHGPSIVIIEASNATWNWHEYDNPSAKAADRIENFIAHGWERVG